MTRATPARVEADRRIRFNETAEEHRSRAETLVRGMEVLTRKFTALEVVPLDVLDRMERCLVASHTANVLRVSRVGEQDLTEDEA